MGKEGKELSAVARSARSELICGSATYNLYDLEEID